MITFLLIFFMAATLVAGLGWFYNAIEANKYLTWMRDYRERSWHDSDRADRLECELEELKEKDYGKENQWLRAQVMRLRVQQAEPARRGWEVCAYLPEELVQHFSRNIKPMDKEFLVRRVAEVLVRKALDGIYHITSKGKVTALVFPPVTVVGIDSDGTLTFDKSDKKEVHISTVFDSDGQFKVEAPGRIYDGSIPKGLYGTD